MLNLKYKRTSTEASSLYLKYMIIVPGTMQVQLPGTMPCTIARYNAGTIAKYNARYNARYDAPPAVG